MTRKVETRLEMLSGLRVQDYLYKVMGDESLDPDVINYINLSLMTGRAEKQSDPSEWTPEENDAYHVKEDWESFSRLRGYTEEEIAQFKEFMRLYKVVEQKYPGISYTVSSPDFKKYMKYFLGDNDLVPIAEAPQQGSFS